jgi:hypothetical protein
MLGAAVTAALIIAAPPPVAAQNAAAVEDSGSGAESSGDDLVGDGVEPAPLRPLVQLEWSENPGVFEEALRRRHQNILYPEARREVSKTELTKAKKVDAKRMWDNLEGFIELLLGKQRMSKLETASEMGDALLQIDEGTWRALRIGGESYALAKSIQEMRTWLLGEWRVSSERDPGVEALLAAENRIPSVKTDSPATRFMALIQSAENTANPGPVPTEEFAAALMSEDMDSVAQILGALRGRLRRQVAEQLVVLLEFVRWQALNPEFVQREELALRGLADKFRVAGIALGKKDDFTLEF